MKGVRGWGWGVGAGTQGFPGTSELRGESMRGTLVSKGLEAAGGTFHLKDCTRFNNNFMAPGSASSLSPAQPHACGCTWSHGGGSPAPGPGSGPGDSPEGTRGGGSRASAEGSRNAEALLRPLRGGGGGTPLGTNPLDPTDLNGAHFDPEVYLDKVCVGGEGEQAPIYYAPDHASDFLRGCGRKGS